MNLFKDLSLFFLIISFLTLFSYLEFASNVIPSIQGNSKFCWNFSFKLLKWTTTE